MLRLNKSAVGRSFMKGSVRLSNVIGNWEPLNGLNRRETGPLLYFDQSFVVVHIENAVKKRIQRQGDQGRACTGLWERNDGLLTQGKGRAGFEGYVGGSLVR